MKLQLDLPDTWSNDTIVALIHFLEALVTALYRAFGHLLEPDGFADLPDWL